MWRRLVGSCACTLLKEGITITAIKASRSQGREPRPLGLTARMISAEQLTMGRHGSRVSQVLQFNPPNARSCTTSAYFGSPRSLLSRWKTWYIYSHTVEVVGSN